jgi:hypothetical protein
MSARVRGGRPAPPVDWNTVARAVAEYAGQEFFEDHWGYLQLDAEGKPIEDESAEPVAFAFFDNHPYSGGSVDRRWAAHGRLSSLFGRHGCRELGRGVDGEGYTAVLIFEGSSREVDHLGAEAHEIIRAGAEQNDGR